MKTKAFGNIMCKCEFSESHLGLIPPQGVAGVGLWYLGVLYRPL